MAENLLRCTNCGSTIFDGTPVCSRCGAVNHEPDEAPRRNTGTDPLQARDLPADGATRELPQARELPRAGASATQELPRAGASATQELPQAGGDARRNALRAKLGAPRPAAFLPDDEASTRIGEPAMAESTQLPGRGAAQLPDRGAAQLPGRGAAPLPASRVRAKTDPEPEAQSGGLSAEPSAKRPASAWGKPAPRKRTPEDTDSGDDDATAPPRAARRPSTARRPAAGGDDVSVSAGGTRRPASRPRANPAPRPTAPPATSGKYATVAEDREPEGTLARPELANQKAAAPPPVDPDELLQSLLRALKSLAFEDKIEVFAGMAMAVMVFMPWRQVKGEGDIGLVTWAGFFSLLFAGGVLALMHLRHTHKVPTLTSKLLSQLELGLAGFQLPLTLIFIFTNIDRHQQTFGSLTTYACMPDFGAVLSLVGNFAMAAGAAMVMQRESRHG